MVAAANSGQGAASAHESTVSRQTYSVEGSGGLAHAKGAKKSALGVFAKLLAGLTRKTRAGGEAAGEIGAEGSVGTEKTAGGTKTASGKKAGSPGAGSPVPGGEKNHNRDRRFLAALKGEGEAPAPKTEDGPSKKTKQAQKNSEGDEAALLVAAEASSGALLRDDPPLEGLEPGDAPGQADQGSLLRLAEAEDQAPEGARSFRARGEETGRAASAEAAPDTSAGAGAGAGAGAEGAAAAFRRTQGAGQEEPGIAKKERAAESRSSRKNRERVVLELRDLRTEGAAPSAGQEPGLEAGAERTADIAVELKTDGGSREPFEPGRAKTAGQAFEDILARELHQNLNGDIVRQASILVKDGGEGTIRLSLKPESLGMVKVRLEMAENKITGRIIVESNEALRAFEREIHSLEQAFRDSGFAGASLEMALAGDGGHNSRGQWDGDPARALLSSRAVSSNYEAAAETMDVFAVEAGFDGFAGPVRVNVLA
jgi:hypothetical protein